MRKRFRRMSLALLVGCVGAWLICGQAKAAAKPGEKTASSVEGLSSAGELLDELEEVDMFLQEHVPGMRQSLSFTDLMGALAAGEGKRAGRMILDAAHAGLSGEIRSGLNTAMQVLAIGLCGAVFTGFSEIFSEGGISDTGFFMTYLMAYTVLAASFFESVQLVGSVLGQQVEFMRMLLPAYLMSVAWTGETMTAAAWYEAAWFLIGAAEWLYARLLLPAAQIFVLLILAGNMARENMLSRLTGFLRGAVRWGIRSLFGVVAGFWLIQGMVLPYADAVKSAGLQKLLAAIPGIGQGVETVAKLMIGSGTLIRNCVGASAIVVLLLVSLVPLLKLAVLLVMYRLTAACLEPTADRRLVGCVQGVADGQQLLLELAGGGMLLFITAVALICLSGGFG